MKRYILRLSDVFLEEGFTSGEVVDLRGIEGTSCYCSADSAAILRERLSEIPLEAIHWIDTGDYHYLTLMFLERIREPFRLVLIDNHPDDQESAFEEPGMLSCGSWVRAARELDFYTEDPSAPAYLSIDLDYLKPEEFKTDWDQGAADFGEMMAAIRERTASGRIIGIDICGGLTRSKGAQDKDLTLNLKVREKLSELF